MASRDDIDTLIGDIVRERLSDDAIERVIVSRETDYAGDPIIDVMVIYRSRPEISKIKGLARSIWNSLNDSDGFPVLSFRSQSEQSKLTRAAA